MKNYSRRSLGGSSGRLQNMILEKAKPLNMTLYDFVLLTFEEQAEATWNGVF